MIQNQLRKLINSKLDVETVLNNLGIKYSNGGEEYKIKCPFHEDSTPSCFINSAKRLFHCFGCQKSGDLIYLMSHVKKVPIESVIQDYIKLSEFPKSLDDYQTYLAATESNVDPDKEYIDDLQFLIDTAYSLLKIYYEKMSRLPVFSDYEQKYYNLETHITNLEEELVIRRSDFFEKRHPPKTQSDTKNN
jgi:DNA primase